MTYPDQSADPIVRLTAYLQRLEARIAAQEQHGFVVPVLDTDPADEDPTNLWLLNDGRLCTRSADGTVFQYPPDVLLKIHRFTSVPAANADHAGIWVGGTGTLRIQRADGTWWTYTADSGTASTASPDRSGTSTVPKPTALKTHQHRAVWSANQTGCYCPRHGREGKLYYGRWSGTHNERRVMYGFNDSNIRSTLSGAVVRKVEMRVKNLHAYSHGGIYVHWGGHNSATLGGTFHQSYRNVWKDHWPKVGGDSWRAMPRWFGTALRDNKIKGLTIDQPSGGVSFYGQMHPGLDLRITYTHKH